MAPGGAATNRRTDFTCQFCGRSFKRLEHVQRHERTHTKEAPFACHCGEAFQRRDLLTRHEKLVHKGRTHSARRRRNTAHSYHSLSTVLSEDNADAPRPVVGDASLHPVGVTPGEQIQVGSLPHADKPARGGKSIGQTTTPNHEPAGPDGVKFLSDQSNLQNYSQQDTFVDCVQQQQQQQQQHNEVSDQGLPAMGSEQERTVEFMGTDSVDQSFAQFLDDQMLLNGHNIFLDDLDFSSLAQSQVPPLYPPDLELVSLGGNGFTQGWLDEAGHSTAQESGDAEDPTTSISRFGSPLPSLEPNVLSSSRSRLKLGRNAVQIQGPFPRKISVFEFQILERRTFESRKDLPESFELPSRHTLSRYVDGCIHGLLEHLPFLHIPTFTVEHAPLELVLSMAAIGADFRFEHDAARTLFYAARSLIMVPIQPSTEQTSHGQATTSSNSRDEPARTTPLLQKIQAMLTIMVMGSWGTKELVRESMSLQSLLAWYVREEMMNIQDDDPTDYVGDQPLSEAHWQRWALFEGQRRTRYMAFCFANLQSLAYNVPPVILASEMRGRLPATAEEWKAASASQWERAHSSTRLSQKTFQEAVDQLFTGSVSNLANSLPFSTAGNFVLIHVILQRIVILRQASQNLSEESITSLTKALGLWQRQWEMSPESNVEPQSQYGPVAFNSTPLLRLSWIRLYSDLGPCRNLASRDPWVIMMAFRQSPPVQRSPKVLHSVLQAAYALSVPIRVGINFVSKTQTLFWSVQHSLSNLECAIFLSKWFETVAQTASLEPITAEEKGLIKMIRYMIDESGLFQKDAFSHSDEDDWQTSVHKLSTAVGRIWAEIFKGNHVFDLVNCIGGGLNIYAEMLEKTHTPIRQA